MRDLCQWLECRRVLLRAACEVGRRWGGGREGKGGREEARGDRGGGEEVKRRRKGERNVVCHQSWY